MKGLERIGVIGAGAWGTALAVTARRAGRAVALWAREPEVVESVNVRHCNELFLPGVPLDAAIHASGDQSEVVAGVDALLLVTPAQHLRAGCRALAGQCRPGLPVVICSKGIELASYALMHEVVAAELPQATIAVLSGPTFAAEVARGQPTAITLACGEAGIGQALVEALGTPSFRPYLSDDLVGAEIGGAVKNVLAIACGIVEGRGFGDNARAALITRGLAELTRLALARGARIETLMGLSGLGDLILTASSTQSRNYSLGFALGEGQSLAEILGGRHSVTEGVHSAAAVVGMADRCGIEMPICAAIDAVINRGAGLEAEIEGLLARPFRNEGV